MINIDYLTPMPALITLGILSVLMLVSSDIFVLINYLSFAEIGIISLSISGLIKMRFTRKDLERPIKVWILQP